MRQEAARPFETAGRLFDLDPRERREDDRPAPAEDRTDDEPGVAWETHWIDLGGEG